jgi:hypothetical protein
VKPRISGIMAGIAIGGLASIGAASADTTTTFAVSGSFTSDEFLNPLPPVPIALGGTLAIDVTNGTITASDLLIPNFSPLDVIDSQSTSPNGTGLLYVLNVGNAAGDSGSIVFIVPLDQSDPLIGHDIIDIDQGEFTSEAGLVVFGLTGDITAVPEPATWTMMLAGIAGVGLAGFRRTRRSAIAIA